MIDSNQHHVPRNTLRLVSLFLALILWVAYSGRIVEQEPEGTRINQIFQVPLIHHGQPSSMEVNYNVFKVLVSLSGKETEMKMLNGDMLTVKLDLSQLGSGKHQVPIPNESVEIPPEFESVKIEAIQPRVVHFELQKKVRKKLKVLVRSKGIAAENYELKSIQVIPEQLTVYGPESEVNDLTFLIAEPVDISGASEDLTGRITFNYEKQVPKNTTIEEGGDLSYLAKIVERTQQLKLGSFKPKIEDQPKAKFRPRTVKVTLLGPISVVSQIQKDWLDIIALPTRDENKPTVRTLTFKWNPPLPQEVPSTDDTNDRLEWNILARLEEVEVQIKPQTVEIK